MRRKRLTKWLAVLAALSLTLWLVSPTWAETGCHKVKGKGGSGGTNNIVQTIG